MHAMKLAMRARGLTIHTLNFIAENAHMGSPSVRINVVRIWFVTYPPIVCKSHEIVFVDEFLWNDTNFDLDFFTIKWCSKVGVSEVYRKKCCIRLRADTVEEEFDNLNISGRRNLGFPPIHYVLDYLTGIVMEGCN